MFLGLQFKNPLCKRMCSITGAAPKIIDVDKCIIKPSICCSKLREKYLSLHRFRVSNSRLTEKLQDVVEH